MRTDLHFGVAVGINQYPALSNLNHARQDAADFHHWLVAEAGVPAENVKLITADDLPPGTTRETAVPITKQIWEALFAYLSKIRSIIDTAPAAWPEGRLYFFFSGHGIAPSARDASGLAADAGPEHYGNSVSIKALVEWLLEAQDFAQLVMMADSCRNKPPAGIRPGPPPWNPRRNQNGEVKLAEFYATIYGDPAREPRPDVDPDGQRGYFTKAILEGLRGRAPIGEGGTITTTDLGAYARQRVMEETGGKQVPPDTVGASFVLVEGVAPTAPRGRPVKIVFPAGFSGPVDLLDAGFQKKMHTDVNDGDWTVNLEPSLYQVVSVGNHANFAADGAFAVPVGKGEHVVAL